MVESQQESNYVAEHAAHTPVRIVGHGVECAAMPPHANNAGRRLEDLLIDPHETLEIELKGWLDITNNNDHKAVLAKSILALANHGGGFIIIGFNETSQGVIAAPNRPANFAAYTPDTVNAVAVAYAEPPFHCDVQILAAPNGDQHPIIVVPGGHRTPIRSKRAGPNGQTVSQNTYYIRRPGPQSEPPQSAAEWDALLRRCMSNARDELLDQMRAILTGGPAQQAQPTELDTASQWFDASLARWQEVVQPLAADNAARMPHGHFAIGYQLFGALQEKRGEELRAAIARAKIRHTGWPAFWVPTRDGIQPYIHDGNVECWIARDGQEREASHADFWRASPQGQMFLMRGLQEDDARDRGVKPGTRFDITIPTWRVGEVLLHAANMAAEFSDPEARVVLIAEWSGLRDRSLIHMEGSRWIHENRTAHQDRFRTSISVQANQIRDSLPELVGRMVVPLYELFDFMALPQALIIEELRRMQGSTF